jgi:hypothetical protein
MAEIKGWSHQNPGSGRIEVFDRRSVTWHVPPYFSPILSGRKLTFRSLPTNIGFYSLTCKYKENRNRQASRKEGGSAKGSTVKSNVNHRKMTWET